MNMFEKCGCLHSCLQLLSGHEGPVSSVSFCPSCSILVSGSWDRSVRVWDVFQGRGNTERLPHTADGQSLMSVPVCVCGGGGGTV